ncbi:MAG: hypothetical protein SF029_16140 [bacterium]|nr:hypothetical protein [bacterium]
MERGRKQPLDFRKEEVAYVMQRWRAAESCALIGVGSVGKSNLLQHLANLEVQKAYMNITGSNEFKAIIIDPNLLGPISPDDSDQVKCWAGYELMMHRLFMAFYPFDVLDGGDAEEFYQTYGMLQNGSNPLYAYMGLRYFERGLDFFMRRGIRIVFMFDEFEEMLRQLPVKFFQTLRGLRDTNKRQLSYLTFTRAPLGSLVEQLDKPELEMEPFTELFNDSNYYVGPYNDIDARRMVDNLIGRNGKMVNDQAVQFLMWATGNYAGLLRAGFRLLDALGPIHSGAMMNDELARQLAVRRPVRAECRTIWGSLTPAEQYVLKAVARLVEYNANPETDQAVAMLVQKRLLRVDKLQQSLHIEPPVFRAFISTNPENELP